MENNNMVDNNSLESIDDYFQMINFDTTTNSDNVPSNFQKAMKKMIATNDKEAFRGLFRDIRRGAQRKYSNAEIEKILESDCIQEKQNLSRYWFDKDGYYKQIIMHYANLLLYQGILIPNPKKGKKLSSAHITKKYHNALKMIEKMQLPVFLSNCAMKALTDGAYYGIKAESQKEDFVVIDLPIGYARTNFKDYQGNDIVEFNISYFNTITDLTKRNNILSVYPAFVKKAFKNFQKGKISDPWIIIPSDYGICFPFLNGTPPFLSVISAVLSYNDSVKTEKERQKEMIKKTVVQKIPHTTDGRLVFEPEEAAEMHEGVVGMMREEENTNVITSYGDVDVHAFNYSSAQGDSVLNRIEKDIYAQGGVSGELFASSGSASLKTSLVQDLSFIMPLMNKFSVFITNHINLIYGHADVDFKYMILPVTWFNQSDYADACFKQAGLGYSAILPAVALGLNQKDLVNIKDLENEVLQLKDKLIPLSSSYTQGKESDEKKSDDSKEVQKITEKDDGGHPQLKEEDRSEKTNENQESKDKTGGS